MDGWMDGWMNGWMDRKKDEQYGGCLKKQRTIGLLLTQFM